MLLSAGASSTILFLTITLTVQYEKIIIEDESSFLQNQLKDFFIQYWDTITAKNETVNEKITVIQMDSGADDIIQWYLNSVQFSYIIGNCDKTSFYEFNTQNNFDYLESPEIFVFVKFNKLQETLARLKNCQLWYPVSNIFFIIYTTVDEVKYLLYCINIIWSKRIQNFVFIYVDINAWRIVSYNEFEDKKIQNTSIIPEKMFPNKLLDINGHEIQVGMFWDFPRNYKTYLGYWTGPDYYLLESLAFMMNATLKIIETPRELHYTGLYEHILEGKIDFSFIPYFQVKIWKGIKFSYPRKLENLVVLVPKAGQIPQSQYIFLIFDYMIYVVIFVLLILITFFLNYAHRVLKNRKTSLMFWFLQSWRALLGSGGYPTFDQMKPIGKFLLTTWMLTSIIIGTSFQCAFTSTLTKAKYFKDINSLADLKKSGLDVLCLDYFRDYLLKAGRTDLSHQLIFASWEQMKELREGHQHLGQIGFVEVFSRAKILAEMYGYHIVEEPIAIGYSVYFFERHSPFLDEIHKCELLYGEMGLSMKQDENLVPIVKRSRDRNTHLTFEHLRSVFFILLFGYNLSFIVFIFELIKKRI